MIKINRGAIPFFYKYSRRIIDIRQDLKRFYAAPLKIRRQQKSPYYSINERLLNTIKASLMNEFHGKCAYCESLIDAKNPGHFDHFRPKGNARGQRKEYSMDHYWPLAFDWRNMYLACDDCGRFKGSWFPVTGKRAAFSLSYTEMIKQEKNLLIDPCNEDPGEHLMYVINGFI